MLKPYPRRIAVSLVLGILLGAAHLALPHAQAVRQDPWGNIKQRFKPGTPFPNIVLPAVDGDRPMSVADFRGRKLLLQIFASG
jgi:hypothetical protein